MQIEKFKMKIAKRTSRRDVPTAAQVGTALAASEDLSEWA